MGEFSNREKAVVARREVYQRLRTYKRLVVSGKMRQSKADREIAVMKEIEIDYNRAAMEDEKQMRRETELNFEAGE
jgi:hypothetical protein